MAVLASAVMANEILPAIHFLLWVWGAGAKDDHRFQPEPGEDEEKVDQPEPGENEEKVDPVEISWRFRGFWLVAAMFRIFLAIRLFNCAAGHVIYSGVDPDGESDPNEKILNAAAMVFVVDIDNIISAVTLPPALHGLLERVPAVSGRINGRDPSCPMKNETRVHFLGLQAWFCCIRFMGVAGVTMMTELMWSGAFTQIWLAVHEVEGPDVWTQLNVNHFCPYILCGLMILVHRLTVAESNRIEQHKALEKESPSPSGEQHVTVPCGADPQRKALQKEAEEAASPASPSLPGTMADE